MSGASATYQVRFKEEGRTPAPEPLGRVPRVARLLALAHRIAGMIQAGELRDLAHAAEVCGLTRARISHISGLALLAPDIQETILDLPPVVAGRDPVTERNLRAIVAEPDWTLQSRAFQKALTRSRDHAHSQHKRLRIPPDTIPQ